MKKIFALGLIAFSSFASMPTYAANLNDFKAQYFVEVGSFSLGKGSHQFRCESNQCTLTSSAKPSGFIRNFFKDELYETVQIQQTDDQFEWMGYQRKDIKYKNSEAREKVKTFKRADGEILFVEKDKIFPDGKYVYDPLSISYAIQWLKLNQKPESEFKQLQLQTDKQQDDISLIAYAKAGKIDLDFASKKLDSEEFSLDSKEYKINLWLLKDYAWFPGKIEIYDKRKDRTIKLILANAPNFQP